MMEDDEVTAEFRMRLQDAVEEQAAGEADFAALHARIAGRVAARLDELRRGAAAGYRATAAAGASWWDYAARAALAGVPLGIAAALLLFTYLRFGGASPAEAPGAVSSLVAAAGGADSALAAFDSVLTGDAAPRAVMTRLIPVPEASFLAESVAGSAP